MDTNQSDRSPSRARKWLVTGAIAGGVALGAAGIANAATGSSTSSAAPATSSPAASSAPAAPGGAMPNPATMTHGPGETVLTGTTADKVKAAALAAEPGATVIRVETDSEGSPYEAHLTKADGTQVTVKVDANFKVTKTESGFGGGPGGGRPGAPGGAPTSGAANA